MRHTQSQLSVTVYSVRPTKRSLALYTFMVVREFRVYDSKARRYAEDNRTESNCAHWKISVKVTNSKKTALNILYY